MKRMSMGQTVLRACFTALLLVALLSGIFLAALRRPEIINWIPKAASHLPESTRMPLIGFLLALMVIAVVFLFFCLAGKVISLALRITGRDPVKQYRKYSQICREHMGDVENRLQLAQPTYTSARIRKFCVRILLILACLLVFFLVVFRVADPSGRVLLGIFLGLLAALGVLLAYFLLWMIATAISGSFVRIRKIRK